MLQEFGVSSYEEGDLKLQFADRLPQVSGADVEGTDGLMLPEGTPDPRALIQKLYAKHGKKGARA